MIPFLKVYINSYLFGEIALISLWLLSCILHCMLDFPKKRANAKFILLDIFLFFFLLKILLQIDLFNFFHQGLTLKKFSDADDSCFCFPREYLNFFKDVLLVNKYLLYFSYQKLCWRSFDNHVLIERFSAFFVV